MLLWASKVLRIGITYAELRHAQKERYTLDSEALRKNL
jgi:hypothetical protein